MSEINNIADSVGYPILAANTTSMTTGVAYIANTGAAQSIDFPKNSSGLYYKVRVVGAAAAEIQCGLYVGLSAGAPTIVLDQASPWANSSAARGATLYYQEFIDGFIPSLHTQNYITRFSWISRTAVGGIEVYMSVCNNPRQIRDTAL